MKKTLFILSLILINITTFSLITLASSDYYLTIEAYVEDMASNADGSISIYFSGGQENRPGHGACKDSWITFPLSDNTPEAINHHLLMATLAKFTHQKVIVYGSQPDCSHGNRIAWLNY